jgi:hypothetical protein
MNREERIANATEHDDVTHEDYENLLDEIAAIRLGKVHAYGLERYKDPDIDHSMTILYSDLYRKFLRVKKAVLAREYNGFGDGETLREALGDLANYAVQGMQILDYDYSRKTPACAVGLVDETGCSQPTRPTFSGVNPELERVRQYVMTDEWKARLLANTEEAAKLSRKMLEASCLEIQDLFRTWSKTLFPGLPTDGIFPGEEPTKPTPETVALGVSKPRIDQIAFVTRDPEKLKELLHAVLGIDEWHRDEVTAKGTVWGHETTNTNELNFNYQAVKDGLEFEILHPVSGNNWLQRRAEDDISPRLSHLGMHVKDAEAVKRRLTSLGYEVAQEVVTTKHTNLAIKNSRRYKYIIFDTVQQLGFYLKIIERKSVEEETTE